MVHDGIAKHLGVRAAKLDLSLILEVRGNEEEEEEGCYSTDCHLYVGITAGLPL
jgi:hypothetical protein